MFRLTGQETRADGKLLTKHLELYEKDTARINTSFKVNWALLILVPRMEETANTSKEI